MRCPLALVLAAGLLVTAPAVGQEMNTDRPGGDYRSFATDPGATFEVCRSACQNESRCRAWSFVVPTSAGGAGHCWLKEIVPAGRPNPRVISGRMTSSFPSAITKRVARTGEVVANGQADLRPAPPLGASVLESFSLAFRNGDHKVRRLGVLDDGRFARFAFADQDSNDPFEGEGAWWSVPDAVEGEVSGTARRRAVVDLPPGPPNHTLVLRGFQVSRSDGTDANVRALGISLDGDARTATVVFSDDEGTDWRGFEATAGLATVFAFFAHDPNTALHLSGADALIRLNGGLAHRPGHSEGRPFAFTVQYAWIPSRLVVAERAMAGTQRRDGRHTTERPASPLALQDFLFTFGNSDHHLERTAVDLANTGSDTRQPNWPTPVFFKDANWDDPMNWAVEYVTLRDH